MNEQSTGVTSTEQTSFIDSLRQAPAGTEGDVALFHVFWNYAALFIGSVHVSWIVLFWSEGIPPLAYLNVVSVGFWCFLFRLNRKPHTQGRFQLLQVLVLLDTVGHASVAVWCLGLEAGYQIYIWAALLGAVFFPRRYVRSNALYLLTGVILYSALNHFGSTHSAVFPLESDKADFLPRSIMRSSCSVQPL